MSKIIKITAFFLFFVMCFCVQNALAQDLSGTCPYTHKWCCWNGEMTCVDKSSSAADYCTDFCGDSLERVDDLTDLPTLDGGILKPVEFCTKGATQEKYTATGCTYETETRTCCGTNWSGWDEDCPTQTCTSCSSATKPSTSQSCKYGNSTTNNGTQTRTVTCNKTTCTWTTGSWGDCQCNDTCSGSDIFSPATCKCCKASCYLNSSAGACNCLSGDLHYNIASRCCPMTNGQEYRLPSTYSDCTTFAEKIGLTAKVSMAYACVNAK